MSSSNTQLPVRVCTALACAVMLAFGCAEADETEPGGEPSAATSAAEQEFSAECPALDGVSPDPAVRAAIEENTEAFLAAALGQDRETLDGLLANAMSYVHENGQISTKQEFFDDYLAKGYTEAALEPKEEMRQFCSTVFAVYTGHLRLNGEAEYPPTTVTHIWAKSGDDWLLVHRHESHKGGPIGPQLPQVGGENNIALVGAKPSPELHKEITDNEAAWVKAMVDTDRDIMEELMGDSLQYVHVTAHTSTRDDFMKELMGGFTETDFAGTTLRQFGNTVIALHNAHYRHVDEPDQSRSQAMHTWVRQRDKWVIVARHSARFEPY